MKVSCFFFNKLKSNFLYFAEKEVGDFYAFLKRDFKNM